MRSELVSPSSGGGLAGRLEAARERAFVGREQERAAFHDALSGGSAVAVLWVHGPGGIGKSTLTRLWVQEALRAGRAVVEVDGRFVGRSPQEFEQTAAAVLEDGSAVLVVDSFGKCQWIEGWLRERFLPRLADGALVVLSGRTRPEVEWSMDPGWSEILRVIELSPMTPGQTGALLAARGVRAADVPAVAGFAGGNPLALSLAAAVLQHPVRETQDWTPTGEVLATLMTRLIGDVPSAIHQRALEIAAQAYSTTEELLFAALPGEDARALFDWLRGLPFMESSPQGLFPHDAARATLAADLRWRSPQAYDAIRMRLLEAYLRQAREAPASQMLEAMGRAFYLYRDVRLVGAMYSWARQGRVYEDDMAPEHLPRVLELCRAAEGEESAELVSYWYAKQPQAFHVFREARSSEVLAFSAHLVLPVPADSEDLATDPVVAAAWGYSNDISPAGPGEHISITRFAVYPPAYEQPSPVLELNHWRALVEAYRATGRAHDFDVYQDMEAWAARFGSAMADSGRSARVGDATYGLFVSDWRLESFEEWFHAVVGGDVPVSVGELDTAVPIPPRCSDQRGDAELEREEFDEYVRLALQTWRHPEGFASNPLLRRSFLTSAGDDTVVVLRAMVQDAADAMRTDLAGVKAHAALAATYFSGAPTQEAAARRLGLPFGTYRRHLRAAVARVSDVLWEAEVAST
ncbi:ATP-binding protein [Micromonospora sp. DT228]|uniref:ATP-binding protein n=1 Tax=Micromonospora sp. DT228 TaxID=3393443 RepID=UPI003CF47736